MVCAKFHLFTYIASFWDDECQSLIKKLSKYLHIMLSIGCYRPSLVWSNRGDLSHYWSPLEQL